MRRKKPFRFRSWPFQPGEVVTLAWICSPHLVKSRDGSAPQWKMNVMFVDTNGHHKKISVAWRQLPLLEMGQRYRDGMPLEGEFQTEELDISISKVNKRTKASVGNAIPQSFYSLYDSEVLREYCWVWSRKGEGSKTYILPIITLIQGLYCIDSIMAEGVLRESFLSHIGSSIENSKLMLQFDSSFKLPRHQKERSALIHVLSRIILDDSFHKSFRSVAIGKALSPDSPIECSMPLVKSEFLVKGISDGKRTLILNMIQVSPAEKLKIDSIGYTHPLYPRVTHNSAQPKTSKKRKPPKGFVIDGGNLPGGLSSSGNKVTGLPPGLTESQYIPVENVGEEEDGREWIYIKNPTGKQESIINFNHTGPNPSFPQGMAVPSLGDHEVENNSTDPLVFPIEDWENPLNDGLDDFRFLLREFRVIQPQSVIKFYVGAGFQPSLHRLIKRPFAFASIERPQHPTVWLLEFAKRPARPLSMLVVTNGGNLETFSKILIDLLTEGLDAQYWWVKLQLESISLRRKIEISRFSHKFKTHVDWAVRLANSI